MLRRPLSVMQLTSLVRSALNREPQLRDVLVEGEVSNLSAPISGHLYFTLKDKTASVRCVCFRKTLSAIPFRPQAGMTIVVHGHLEIYDQAGSYQLYADNLEPSGIGALALAIEQRKQQLAAEGLFDEARKRPLPLLPRRVAVVTSLTGAALRDVVNVIRRRAPGMDIVVVPAVVQGLDAVPTLVTALSDANGIRDADVILLVRGGGSLEDLMSFNDVSLVRAIARSRLPVVVGVGHETDVTIADLVADRRAPTPSAAAELAVPSIAQLRGELSQRVIRYQQAAQSGIRLRRALAQRLEARLLGVSPQRRVASLRQTLDSGVLRLRGALMAEVAVKRRQSERSRFRLENSGPQRRVTLLRAEIGGRRQRLRALSPLAVLDRGYSITTDAATGKVATAASVGVGDRLRTRLRDGSIETIVSERMYDTGEHE